MRQLRVLSATVSVAGSPERKEQDMKEGFRFVDCDMHIMEPTDLFDRYLDPAFKPR